MFLQLHKNCLYYPENLNNWYAALEALKTNQDTTLNLNIIGDSITNGSNAGSTVYTAQHQSFVGVLRRKLHQIFSDTGEGFIQPYFFSPTARKVTYTGTWNEGVGGGMFSNFSTTNVGDSVTIPFNGVGITIFYEQDPRLGTFTVTIDDDVENQITVNSAGTVTPAKSITINELSNGNHTAVLTFTGNGSWISYDGFFEIKPNHGVRVNRIARPGASSGYIHTTPDTLKCIIDNFAPSLTVLMLGVNDYLTSYHDEYESRIQATISRIKNHGECLVIVPPEPTPVHSPDWGFYRNILYGLAESNDCALLDLTKQWNNREGLLDVDGVHWTFNGHQDVGRSLIYSLIPATLRTSLRIKF